MEEQTKLCALFKTNECEQEQHNNCYGIYGSEELNLEAKCICDCHSENKEIIQPLARRSKLRASDMGQQLELGNFGDAINGIRADNK